MLRDLVAFLIADNTLAGLLAVSPFDDASVYTEWAPEAERPYITLTYSEASEPGREDLRTGTFDFDIWGDGAVHEALEPIRDRLVELLDHKILDASDGSVRFFYGEDGPEQESDPNVVRWRVSFGFRRSRVTLPNQ